MTSSFPLEQSPCHFDGPFGYRFDADRVTLECTLSGSDERDLLLQLWANAEPGDDPLQGGIKVAEAIVYRGLTTPSVNVPAALPAGPGPWQLSLALFAREPSGDLTCLDLVRFHHAESFAQPHFDREPGFRYADGTVSVGPGSIASPRDADNRSGSLLLQLWALPAPYLGGAFEGDLLTQTQLGTIAGQTTLALVDDVLSAAQPSGGHLVLMLREWTESGYLTRDFRVLPAAAPRVDEPTETVPTAEAPKAAVAAETAAPVQVAVDEATEKAVTETATVEEPAVEEAVAEAPVAESATEAPTKDAPETAITRINRADLKHLRAVKGLSVKVASAIIAAQPFADEAALLAVKGLGHKISTRILEHFGK